MLTANVSPTGLVGTLSFHISCRSLVSECSAFRHSVSLHFVQKHPDLVGRSQAEELEGNGWLEVRTAVFGIGCRS